MSLPQGIRSTHLRRTWVAPLGWPWNPWPNWHTRDAYQPSRFLREGGIFDYKPGGGGAGVFLLVWGEVWFQQKIWVDGQVKKVGFWCLLMFYWWLLWVWWPFSFKDVIYTNFWGWRTGPAGCVRQRVANESLPAGVSGIGNPVGGCSEQDSRWV